MCKRNLLSDPRTLALTGVMTAIIFILTRAVQVPTPVGGYIHLGDAGVLFTSFAFGPVVGALAGALGTALADVTSPYAQWAPFTLIIHGLMGLLAGTIVRRGDRLQHLLVACAGAGIVLVGGYFVAGLLLVGMEAALEIGPNVSQIIGGAIVSIPLYFAVRRAYPPLIWHNQSPKE